MSNDRFPLNAAAGRANQGERNTVPKGAGRRLGVVLVVHSTTRALSGSAVDELTGGVNQLAKTFVCPGIKLVSGVNWKLSCFAEAWSATTASVLCKCGWRAGDPVGFADIAGSVSAPHVLRDRCGLHIELRHWLDTGFCPRDVTSR
jgi:hypothetical protein